MDSPALAMGSVRVGHLFFLFLLLLWGSWGLVLLVGFSSELGSVTEGWMVTLGLDLCWLWQRQVELLGWGWRCLLVADWLHTESVSVCCRWCSLGS